LAVFVFIKARGVIDIQTASNNQFRAIIYAEPFTYDRNSGFKTLTSTPTDLRPYLDRLLVSRQTLQYSLLIEKVNHKTN
jgi:hypothetical protein